MSHSRRSTPSQKEFRDRSYFYHQAADFQYDTMMLQLKRKT